MSDMKKMSQEKRVWEYLNRIGPLTSLHAREALAIIDLPKRISVLRQRGYKIAGETVTVKNRWGEPCRVKRYSIPKEQPELIPKPKDGGCTAWK